MVIGKIYRYIDRPDILVRIDFIAPDRGYCNYSFKLPKRQWSVSFQNDLDNMTAHCELCPAQIIIDEFDKWLDSPG